MLKSKKFKALCCALALAFVVPVAAFAASYPNYAITDASPTGRDVDLGPSVKYYTFKMTGPSTAAVSVQLWQKRYFGDYHWPDDQTFQPSSSNQTAWWYAYQEDTATYHLSGEFIGTNGQSVTLNGTLFNQ